MNDPVSDRLRSYYLSIQRDPPASFETRVDRALRNAPPARAGFPWRPAAALLAAGAVVLVLALVARDILPGPVQSPSAVTGPSASPTGEPSPTASPSPTPTPSPSPSPSESPSPIPTPVASQSPTSTPAATLIGSPFAKTGPMNPVIDGPAVTLKDGRVLVVGGMTARSDGMKLRTNVAEIYNPATNKFTTTGSMAEPRTRPTATLLADGRVLVTGGADLNDGYDNQATAEIYDPGTGKFTPTGSMLQGRAEHTATLLPDGRVLVTGGFGGGTNARTTAEIYDPSTGRFTATGSMGVTRQYQTATLLPNGLVLIAGGLDDGGASPTGVTSSAELYDPATGSFTPTGPMNSPRAWHTATLLPSGLVLVAGGVGANQTSVLATAELYQPATGSFVQTGSMLVARSHATATPVTLGPSPGTGAILVAGGQGLTTCEIYYPATGKFGSKATMLGQVSAAAPLGGGRVLLLGNPAMTYPALIM